VFFGSWASYGLPNTHAPGVGGIRNAKRPQLPILHTAPSNSNPFSQDYSDSQLGSIITIWCLREFSWYSILTFQHVLCDLQAASQRLGSHSATPSSAHQGSDWGVVGFVVGGFVNVTHANTQSPFFFRGCNPLSPTPCMCITSPRCSQAALLPHSAGQLTTITTEVDLGLPHPLVTWSLNYFML